MTWLITGGAGYIGSHIVAAATRAGIKTVVIDDLSTGMKDRIPEGIDFYQADIADRTVLRKILQDHDIKGLLHLAARKQVGESVQDPFGYWESNVGRMQVLLEEMTSANVKLVVFSSSAAVYGSPITGGELDENALCLPINPYGATKLAGELLIDSLSQAGKVNSLSLRYFNVAGAEDKVLADRLALNLIPIVLSNIDAGKDLPVFGTDYATPDGTCIRDYVHVVDLAEAHVAAMQHLEQGAVGHTRLNIGTGTGSSVLEIVHGLEEIMNSKIAWSDAGRRAGDPAALVAKVGKVTEVLGWSAKHDLRDILQSAWDAWPKSN
jgi:UDP-glucose 4-epimerase